jgi:hypothetical protein
MLIHGLQTDKYDVECSGLWAGGVVNHTNLFTSINVYEMEVPNAMSH